MRNLKKVLSLSLALVMLIGMMVVGAGAAPAFNDVAADADKAEAIEVMSAIKVLTGKGDGNFDPEGTLKRAEAAVIISKVLLTPAVVDRLKGVESRFTDVDDYEGGWAVPYVEACAQQQIIIGNGDGTFGPDDKVTAVQFAKMLLVTLGFDPARYSNSSTWELTVRQDALKAGLDANGVALVGNLTREDAAQMAFNALFYSPSGERTYKVGDHTFATAADAYFYHASLTSAQQAANPVTISTASDSLAVKNFKLVQNTNSQDDFGRPATTYTLDSKPLNIVSAPGEAYVTYTSNLNNSNGKNAILKDLNGLTILGNTPGTGDVKITSLSTPLTTDCLGDDLVLTNSAAVAPAVTNLGANSDVIINKIAALTGNGKIVSIYVAENAISKIVVIDKKVSTLVGDPVTRVEGKETQVRIPGVSEVNWVNVDDVFGWEDLAKGDVVLYVQGANGHIYLEKAAVLEARATAKRGTTELRIDGAYYAASDLTGKLFTVASFDAFNKDYTFYLDNNGSIVKAEAVGTAAATDQYAVVLKHGWKGLSTEIGASTHAQATLLFTDGTQETVAVSKVGTTDLTIDNYATQLVEGNIYTYTVGNDGFYTLKTVTTTAINQMRTGNAALKTDKSLVGNANTVVLVKGGNPLSPTYTVYNGVNEMPTLQTGMTGVAVANSAGVASLVYVSAGAADAAPVGTYFYVPASASSVYVAGVIGGMGEHYEIEAYVDGALSTVYMNDTVNDAVSAGGLFVAQKQNKGIVTVVDATTNADKLNTSVTDTDTGISVAGQGTLAIGSPVSGVYNIDEDTVVYYIAADGESLTQIEYTELAGDETDVVHVKAAAPAPNGSVHADVVYVKAVSSSNRTPSAITVKVNGNALTAGDFITAISSGDDFATASGKLNDNRAKIGQTITIVPTVPAGSRVENIRVTGFGTNGNETGDARIGSANFKIKDTADSSKKITFTYTVVAEDGTTDLAEKTLTLQLGTVKKQDTMIKTVTVENATINGADANSSDLVKTFANKTLNLGTVTIPETAGDNITITLAAGTTTSEIGGWSIKANGVTAPDHTNTTAGETDSAPTFSGLVITIGKEWTEGDVLSIVIVAADGTEATYTLRVVKAS